MNIYKVTQSDNKHYQAIKSFICYAVTETEAKNINPCETDKDQWSLNKEELKVNYVGSRSNAPRGHIVMREYYG